MEIILLLLVILPPVLFGGGLLMTSGFSGGNDTMTNLDRRAAIFEIYRYSICYLMVIMFGLTAFQLIGAALTDYTNTAALAGPAVGVVLSAVLFVIHWKMKSPAPTAE